MWKLARVLVVCAAVTCACSSSTNAHTLVIRGRVATGAHTRTPVSGGYIGVLGPQGANAGHWVRYASPSSSALPAVTNSDGTYSYTVEVSRFSTTSKGFPFFIAVSDAAQTFTMLAEIPRDLIVEDADITIDINPTTTTASQMICPGGAFPPPANTWCYSDPATASTSNTGLIDGLDNALGGTLIALETGSPPDWNAFASGFLNDPPTFTAIKNNLSGRGITIDSAATPSGIASSIAPLPLIHPLTASTPPPPSSGGGCQLVWDCKGSAQCADVYGAPNGKASQPDAQTCASTCKSQGACTCQGC
jgi:hypothetical protein